MALDADDGFYGNLFDEPDAYRPQSKPHGAAEYTLQSGERLQVRLVGHSPLWGHVLWNAAKVAAAFLEEHANRLVSGKDVLELGAGAGVPSLVCALRGARRVVISDYPDQDLIDNIRFNVESCSLLAGKKTDVHVQVLLFASQSRSMGYNYRQGYIWGQPLRLTGDPSPTFDILILADVVFNHSEHQRLITTIKTTLKRSSEAKALVFFTPHRPWLLEKDLDFFELSKQAGFRVEPLLQKLMDRPMYAEDPGDETLRRTVFGYQISWP